MAKTYALIFAMPSALWAKTKATAFANYNGIMFDLNYWYQMNVDEFKSFSEINSDLLDGVRPNSFEEMLRFETALGFPLPNSMKWLLTTKGYSSACGIDNLSESVDTTIACRSTICLPSTVLIINDWNDSGVVFLIVDDADEREYAIYWGDVSELHRLAEGGSVSENTDKFCSYMDWVAYRVDFERENS